MPKGKYPRKKKGSTDASAATEAGAAAGATPATAPAERKVRKARKKKAKPQRRRAPAAFKPIVINDALIQGIGGSSIANMKRFAVWDDGSVQIANAGCTVDLTAKEADRLVAAIMRSRTASQ